MVLQTGQEINELDSSGFCTTQPTVFAGNIGGSKFIVQVTPDSVLLLEHSELVQKLSIDLGCPIQSACVADPHLALLGTNGECAVLSLQEGGQLRVVKQHVGEMPGRAKSAMVAISLYRDTSGLLTTVNRLTRGKERLTHRQASAARLQELDEEDELLYGASTERLEGGAAGEEGKGEEEEGWRRFAQPINPTYWLVTVRANGNLELYSVPDCSLRFLAPDFPLLPDVLADMTSRRQGDKNSEAGSSRGLESSLSPLTELLLVGLGSKGRRPLLLARTRDGELVIYQVYEYFHRAQGQDQLKLRFKKVRHGLLLRERRSKARREAVQGPILRASLRYFSDIQDYEGVFVSGPYPHWLFLTGRGELRTHPMAIDGSVSTFAPFHNVNCPRGFLYFNRKSELRICVLPAHLSYDAPWPVRKVPLRCSPHYITFHIESKTFAVVTSLTEPTNKIWKFNGDDKELSIEDRSDRFVYPSLEKFSLQLFSPSTWEAVPGTKIHMEDWESITCMKHLYLSSEGMHSGQRGFIVAGTNFSYGEDITSRGHIKIYDVIEVVPEPGQPLTKNKIKTMYDKEQKGAVTAIAAVSGFLVSTVGQKIYIWQFKDKDLHGIAFIDSAVYVHQIHTLKNFLLVGDVYKSINVLQYQQDYRTVSLISR